LIRCEELKN